MAFDKDIPAASSSLRASNPEILANQSQIQTGVNNEHIFSGTDAATQTGDHTQGSARCYSQAEAPATRIDGNNFISTDLGSLWIDTDDNAMYILTATVPTWTPVSTEVIAILLASNRVFAGTLGVDGNFEVGTGSEFTVAAASGNTVIAGTLDVTGATELIGIATIADDSVTKTSAVADNPAEIANLATVDAQIEASITAAASGGLTGTLDTNTASFSKLIEYPGGLKVLMGYDKDATDFSIDISSASFTGIYSVNGIGYDLNQPEASRGLHVFSLTLTTLVFGGDAAPGEYDGLFYRVEGY